MRDYRSEPKFGMNGDGKVNLQLNSVHHNATHTIGTYLEVYLPVQAWNNDDAPLHVPRTACRGLYSRDSGRRMWKRVRVCKFLSSPTREGHVVDFCICRRRRWIHGSMKEV